MVFDKFSRFIAHSEPASFLVIIPHLLKIELICDKYNILLINIVLKCELNFKWNKKRVILF